MLHEAQGRCESRADASGITPLASCMINGLLDVGQCGEIGLRHTQNQLFRFLNFEFLKLAAFLIRIKSLF
jgi:hypothetical protein